MTDKKENSGRFQKGNKLSVGNKGGRPALTETEKAERLVTRTQFKSLMSKYASWTKEEVDQHLEKCTGLSVMDTAVLKHLSAMHEVGSMERVDWTLDHIMGTRPKQSEVTVNQGKKKLDLTKMTPQQLKDLKKIIEQQEESNEN